MKKILLLGSGELGTEISNRVGVLEKWRWLIIGGSIVLGFIIQKLPIWGS